MKNLPLLLLRGFPNKADLAFKIFVSITCIHFLSSLLHFNTRHTLPCFKEKCVQLYQVFKDIPVALKLLFGRIVLYMLFSSALQNPQGIPQVSPVQVWSSRKWVRNEKFY